MKKILIFLAVMTFMFSFVAAGTANDAIISGANRLVETQNNDGSWEWTNPDVNKTNGPGAGNTYGVTAMGLLLSYESTGNVSYLDAAEITGADLVAKIPDATNGKFYSQDIEFLAKLGILTGNSTYSDKAEEVMNYFMTSVNRYCATGCTAAGMAAFYQGHYSNPADAGLTEWQLSSWVRAADLTGNSVWADDMVSEILNDISTYFSVDTESTYYIIGLAGVLDATGDSTIATKLLEIQESDGSWSSENSEGDAQGTSYAIMALLKKGGQNNLESVSQAALWLIQNQGAEGGWYNDEGVENTELTSEALWALGSVVNSEVDLTGDMADWIVSINVLPSLLDFGTIPRGSEIFDNDASDIIIDTSGSDTASDNVWISVSVTGDDSNFYNNLLEFNEDESASKNDGDWTDVTSLGILQILERSSETYGVRLHGTTWNIEPGVKSATIVYTAYGESISG